MYFSVNSYTKNNKMVEKDKKQETEEKEEVQQEKAEEKTEDKKESEKEDKELEDKEKGEEKNSKENTESEIKEEEAEKESLDEEKAKELEEKRKKIKEKAEQLKQEKVQSTAQVEELKKEIKGKKEEMLVPLEEYVKSGIYLGTRVVTPNMRQYVYRRRADGLAIFNTDLIDEKLKEAAEYLSRFNPEDVIVVCKREAGWRVVEKFAELTGARAFTKKYPAGILTNTSLPDFFENELTIVTDAWIDKNALRDTLRVNKNVLMVCDTNNFAKDADQIILGNNKSPRSLGLIYYILTREYLKALGKDTSNVPDLEWWTGELQNSDLTEKEAKQKSRMRGAKHGV